MCHLLHQLLEQNSSRYPDKQAVIYKAQNITYRELDEVSNQLAHVLRRRGIQRGDRVGLYLGKSIEAVVAVFGILKAGAVYVPLDPSSPNKRIGQMMDNCGMKALVTNSKKIAHLWQALPGPSGIQCVVLTDAGSPEDAGAFSGATMVPWNEVLRSPPSAPITHPIEDDLAYILYTSGSTGEPKGVMISHRASLSFVNWAYDCFQVQPRDRVSNHAPLHFDLSVFDIFTTIKAGGAVCIVPDELSIFPLELASFIEEQAITIWYSVPSVLTRLALHGGLERHGFSNLRTILFAGEIFPIKYLRQLKSFIPRAQYYNLYGPTESNVCTYYPVKAIPPDRTEPFPIGKACANTEVFAVNDRHEIAAQGEIGELHVRGASLMKGYWGMPQETQKVLVPHPFLASACGEKVYRTGDLVKQDQDGNYLFVGRRDHMIKSRGYRIELGEIETVLYSHPKVAEVAVISIPDEEMGNRIIAVVVTGDVSGSAQNELKRFCSERLPKYMIPDIIEPRLSLPRTSTGKIDRTSLLKAQFEGRSPR